MLRVSSYLSYQTSLFSQLHQMTLNQRKLNQQVAPNLYQLMLRVPNHLSCKTSLFYLLHQMILDERQLNQQAASSLNQ
jgi:hypothetical protein